MSSFDIIFKFNCYGAYQRGLHSLKTTRITYQKLFPTINMQFVDSLLGKVLNWLFYLVDFGILVLTVIIHDMYYKLFIDF